jgi:hypothetical protein
MCSRLLGGAVGSTLGRAGVVRGSIRRRVDHVALLEVRGRAAHCIAARTRAADRERRIIVGSVTRAATAPAVQPFTRR